MSSANNNSPYRPPDAITDDPDAPHAKPLSRLWTGFLFAPPVGPILGAITFFVLGMLFSDPQDTGTPIGIVAVPMMLVTVGIVVAYLMMGVIGVPVVWHLDRKGKLNSLNLFLAALGVSAVCGLGMLWMVLLNPGRGDMSAGEVVFTFVMMTLMFALFVVTTAGVFWLIIRKQV